MEVVNQGLFRDDLLYRINTIEIVLPPLRERGNDVIILAEHYLKYYSNKYNKKGFEFSANALEKLKSYTWPGNIRELRHTIEIAVMLSDSKKFTKTDLYIQSDAEFVNTNITMSLEVLEKKAILRVLKKNKWNHSHTANELEIARTTLIRKLKKYGLT